MYAWARGVSFIPIDGEGIVVDTNTGVYVSINGTAVTILMSLIDHDRKDAVESLLTRIDVPLDVLERDIDKFLAELGSLGLLERAEEA